MFVRLYQNTVIEKPRIILALLILCLLFFGYYTKDFRLDASSDTLLIENDPDLKYLREVTDRYGAKEFLVLTFTPKESLISDSSINNLLNLKKEIQNLDWVHSVITILDIPLLENSDKPLSERLGNFVTLKNEGVDKNRGFNEILNSPVFRNFVISEDGTTTGIIVNIKAIKLDEITVTFPPNNPSSPVIIITAKKQLLRGTIIQSNFLKTNQRVATINKKTHAPNTVISFFINDIMSSAIIGIPPR